MKKAAIAIAEVMVGVILMGSTILTVPTKTHAEIEADTWLSEPTPPKPQSSPLAPVVAVVGLAGIGKGIFDFWKSWDLPQEEVPAISFAEELTMPQPQDIYRPSFQQPQQQPQQRPTTQTSPTVQQNKAPSVPLHEQTFEQRKEYLWKLLSNAEYAWLLRCLKAAPILVWGGQGSGKTTFVSFLCLLRKLYVDMTIEINDPHAHLNNWPEDLFQVYGHRSNYPAIGRRLAAYYGRVKAVGNHPHTSVWDEFTQYAERIEDENLTNPFTKSILSDARKAQEFPIQIAHGRTQGATGGGSGTHEMKGEGLVTIHLFARRDEMGEPRPAFKGTVEGLDLDDYGKPKQVPVKTDTWMTQEFLFDLFPELRERIQDQQLEPIWEGEDDE